jgi:salicylate hydroxylase
MKCRYERATMVQNFSRQAAFKISAKDTVGGTSTDRECFLENNVFTGCPYSDTSEALEFMRINFGHDAHDFAANMLHKYLGTSLQNFPLHS